MVNTLVKLLGMAVFLMVGYYLDWYIAHPWWGLVALFNLFMYGGWLLSDEIVLRDDFKP